MMRTGFSKNLWLPLAAGILLLFIPLSPVQAADKQADNTCIACHSTLDDERLRQPVTLWSGSVHADVGNTCDGCHGGNPAEPTMQAMSKTNHFKGVPARNQVTGFCGKCHPQTVEPYKNSAHFQAGQPTCIDCHSNHAIRRSAADMVTPERCSLCHDYAPAEQLKTLLVDLSTRLQATRQRIGAIHGFPTQPFEQQQSEAMKTIQTARQVSHSLNLQKLEAETGDANHKLDALAEGITHLETLSQDRKHLGWIAIVLFLALGAVTWFFNEQNKKDEERHE